MRIAVLDTCYPAFLRAHYERHPGLETAPYEQQLASLLEFSFGTSDAYAVHLRELGHPAENLITNCLPLQLAWAREHAPGLGRLGAGVARVPGRAGVAVRQELFERIASRQLDALRPDVVFVHDMWSMSPRRVRAWRSSGRFLVSQIASPAPPATTLRAYDLILSSFHHFVERFRALGIASEFFRLGFYSRVHDRLRAIGIDPSARSARDRDVVFVGGIDPNVHAQGTAFLEHVCERFEVDVWGYGASSLPASSPILKRYHGEAWGLDMYEILASARIVLNRHIDVAEGQANNMRLYEATGSGALLITDDGRNLEDLFHPGKEVVSYGSVDELEAHVRHYLAADDERCAIAEAGQRRTLEEHCYADRMEELVELLEAALGDRSRSAISSSHAR